MRNKPKRGTVLSQHERDLPMQNNKSIYIQGGRGKYPTKKKGVTTLPIPLKRKPAPIWFRRTAIEPANEKAQTSKRKQKKTVT